MYSNYFTQQRFWLLGVFLSFGLILPNASKAQSITVTGTVTVEPDQEKVPGVNVVVKGSSSGTVTDIDGNYRIEVPSPEDTLVVSYVGYASKEVPVNGQSTINVTLSEDVEQLEEVVVVGYGTQKKSDLTGAVSNVKSEDITKIGAGIPSEALQGKVAGVNVTPSGVPGQQPTVNIRGVGTLGNSNPLYVVDGVLLDDISFLNNNDIQSMEVLKDASATAIYGSRGANGVIIITTKSGSSEDPQFSFNMYEGVQNVNYNGFGMVNTDQYVTLVNESLANSGQPLRFNADTISNSTDWFDEVYRPAAIRDYQVSFNQKTDRASYFVSAGYFGQQGVLKKSNFDRFTLRLNNSYKLTDYITIGHNVSGSWTTADNPTNSALQSAYRMSPVVPVTLEDGSYGPSLSTGTGNPAAIINYYNNSTVGQRIVGNVYADVKFLKDFTFRSSLGLDYRTNQTTGFSPVYEVNATQRNQQSSISKTWERWGDWLWENTVTWDKTFGEHHLNVLGGITAQNSRYEILNGSNQDVFGSDPSLWYLNAADPTSATTNNYAIENTIASYLFRANYTLMNKYLFTATFRADGSSRFASNDRWGYFPSLAVGWNISEENFMANADWLDNLKFRASWGQIGNQNILDYQYYSKAAYGIDNSAIFNNQLVSGSTITQLNNANITWETTTQTDIGLEFGLLKGALNFEVDYYHRSTEDILINLPVPGTVGLTASDANVGAVMNRGFDFSARYQKSMGDFSFNVGLVGTTIYNEVTDLGSREEITGGDIGTGTLVSRATVGNPIGYFYGYNVVGVFQNQQQIDNAPTQFGLVSEPGDLQFEDVNGDGVVDADDRTILGSPIPKFTGGLNLGFNYKNFDLSIDFAGAFGQKIFNAKRQERYDATDNYDISFLDRWTGEGTSNTEPRLTSEDGPNKFVSSRFVESGDFVKIRNLQLGYNLPNEVAQNIKLQNVRVYLSANNLYYFTKYNGFTPEFNSQANYESDAENANDATTATLGNGIDRTVYPVTSVYKIGLNVTF